MFRSFLRLVQQLSRRLVVRVLLIAALAFLALALSILLAPFLPDGVSMALGAGSLDTILNTLAGSMLAVTTFSLSILANAYHAASNTATPRARAVLREDTTTQSVLATFVGAFLFSLIAIILRATPLMGERESVILFLFAVVVVGLVIVAMIRWINVLETLGSLESTVARLQAKALAAAADHAAAPTLGCNRWSASERDLMAGKPALQAGTDGYVQQIFEDALQAEAQQRGARYYIAVQTGDYVLEGEPLMYLQGADTLTAPERTLLRECFLVRPERAVRQDLLHGVQSLTEVASRALSPGINDPQTAVDVTHKISAVLRQADPSAKDGLPELRHDRLWVIPRPLEAFYSASFDVIARDAGDVAEVRAALAEALRRLARTSGPEGCAEAERCLARLGLEA